MPQPTFQSASPYQEDVLALPVTDLDAASAWYSKHFGMAEVHRTHEPASTVVLERDGIRIGFAVNGGDASQDGAAIRVNNIVELKKEFDAMATPTSQWRIDNHEEQPHRVFFVVAPDGLCFYFHEPVAE